MPFHTGSTSSEIGGAASSSHRLPKSRSADVLENMAQQLRDKVGHKIHMLRLQVRPSDQQTSPSTDMPIICNRRIELPVCTSAAAGSRRNSYQSVMTTSAFPSVEGRCRSSLNVVSSPSSAVTSPIPVVTSYINGHLTRSTSYNELVNSAAAAAAAAATSRSYFKPFFTRSQSPKEREFPAEERRMSSSSASSSPPSTLTDTGRQATQLETELTDDARALVNDDKAVTSRCRSMCFNDVSSAAEDNSSNEIGAVNECTSAATSVNTIAALLGINSQTGTPVECLNGSTHSPVSSPVSSPGVGVDTRSLIVGIDQQVVDMSATAAAAAETNLLSSSRLVAKYANSVRIFNVDCRNGRHNTTGSNENDVTIDAAAGDILNTSASAEILKITLEKGVLGLGFCIDGGRDAPMGPTPISVKRLFKGDTAAKDRLKAGDEILGVNEYSFDNVTHFDAWKVLKNLPNGLLRLTIRRKLLDF